MNRSVLATLKQGFVRSGHDFSLSKGVGVIRRQCSQSVTTNKNDVNRCVSDHLVEKTPITVQLWEMRSRLFMNGEQQSHPDISSAVSGNSDLVPSQLTKTTADSRNTITYNFQSDPKLRDLYIDPVGNMIVGKLFEGELL
jgi:hypothetical protein